MEDGQVVIEAESYHTNATQGAVDMWQELSVDGISGGVCMEVGPEDGTFWTTDPSLTAPRLDYNVYFTETGTFYIYVRGDQSTGAPGHSDSCYAGVDGVPTDEYAFSTLTGTWEWIAKDVEVATLGVHTINIFAREDGFRVDKIVVSKSATAPTGNGPPESPQR